MTIEPYTVALTSCGRFDLLERTLRSLLPRLDGPIERVLIGEDSGNRHVLDVVQPFKGQYAEIEVIINDPPLGQVKSIDRLYSKIETEWVFHCEDDWEFFSDGFIEKSFIILKDLNQYSMVSIRDFTKFNVGYFLPGRFSHSGVDYFAVNPSTADIWSGLSFNPGLRRMRDYSVVGPYADLDVTAGERHVSVCYRELGYSFVYLAEPAARHIGSGRHIRSQVKPVGLGSKMIVSMQKRLTSLHRKFVPERDPIRRARQRLERGRSDDGNFHNSE